LSSTQPERNGEEEAAAGNAEVVRRYLHIFETRTVDELAGLVAPDVDIHGAGSHISGRDLVVDSVLTPGLPVPGSHRRPVQAPKTESSRRSR
jgi:hypothetical protein